MAAFEYALAPNLVVNFSLTSEKINGQITKVKIWIQSLVQLADPVAFVQANDLIPEILVKAGIADDPNLSVLTLLDSSVDAPYYNYELQLAAASISNA